MDEIQRDENGDIIITKSVNVVEKTNKDILLRKRKGLVDEITRFNVRIADIDSQIAAITSFEESEQNDN